VRDITSCGGKKVDGVTLENQFEDLQGALLSEFYAKDSPSVAFPKKRRDEIWKAFKDDRSIQAAALDRHSCETLYLEMEKALRAGRNIQSAVFSECVYAKALGDQLEIRNLILPQENNSIFNTSISTRLDELGINPRYIYANQVRTRFLIQAGGPQGSDCALVEMENRNFTITLIEFKEPASKTTEADLPPYREDGLLTLNAAFESKHPQYVPMIQEQISRKLNVYEYFGHNINDFSKKSILDAVLENFQGSRSPAVICTEDAAGFLTMIPTQDVNKWARLEGEIRPAGRNNYEIWTPRKFAQIIGELGGDIREGEISIPRRAIVEGYARGGHSKIPTRLKIGTIFFIRPQKLMKLDDEQNYHFSLADVRQLRPTVAAKMFFNDLDARMVGQEYRKKG